MLKNLLFLLWSTLLGVMSLRPAYLLANTALMRPESQPGNGETIVMMHGLLGNARNIMSIAKLLQKTTKADIVVFDLPSHGQSRVLGDLELEYREMAEDIIFSMKRLGLDKRPVHLIGHSMGGKVAAATSLLSERRGVDVRSATILDISPIEYSADEFDEVFKALDFLEETHGDMEAGLINKGDVTKLIDSNFDDKGFSLFLQSNLVVCERTKNIQWKFSVPGIVQSRENILKWPFESTESFERPILIYKGGDSHFVKTSHLERVRQNFPLFTLQSLKGAGHWLHAEKPEETAEKIAEFIAAAQIWHEQRAADDEP